MDIVECLSELMSIMDGIGFVEWGAKPQPSLGAQQGPAAHKFTRYIKAAIQLAIIQDGRQVGMIDGAGSLQFAEELAARGIRQRRLWLDQLERHFGHEHCVFGFITLAGYSAA